MGQGSQKWTEDIETEQIETEKWKATERKETDRNGGVECCECWEGLSGMGS